MLNPDGADYPKWITKFLLVILGLGILAVILCMVFIGY